MGRSRGGSATCARCSRASRGLVAADDTAAGRSEMSGNAPSADAIGRLTLLYSINRPTAAATRSVRAPDAPATAGAREVRYTSTRHGRSADMTTATRAKLRSKAGLVEDLIESEVDYRKVEDAVLDLANALPAGTEDYEAKQLFVFLTELRRAIDDGGDVQLAAMRMADVARRLERRLAPAVLETRGGAVGFVLPQLEPLTVTEIARLFGVSTKTVGAWRAGKPVRQRVERVLLVAQLVSYLRYGMTATGLRLWFENPADQLGGKTPLE